MVSAKIIALSAFLARVLDISVPATVMASQGVSVKSLLQFIASGAFGPSAFNGGMRTAGIGLLFHFRIASIVATIYYAMSRSLPVSLGRPVLFGILYGITVHLVMSRIVVPLSRAPKRSFSINAFLTQLQRVS
jgi:uncharacterized membrane protein YagU involved in acid resistance